MLKCLFKNWNSTGEIKEKVPLAVKPVFEPKCYFSGFCLLKRTSDFYEIQGFIVLLKVPKKRIPKKQVPFFSLFFFEQAITITV